MTARAEATSLAHKHDTQVEAFRSFKRRAEMTNILIFLVGFAVGVVLTGLFEQRAVNEVEKLRAYMSTELQKLAAKL